ncbi:MAG: hypothetical protein NXI24_10015 [bacterium]|nr:hypothetical protein [bacterium]
MIRIDLKENGGVHQFEDAEELLEWLNAEFEKWKWLGMDYRRIHKKLNIELREFVTDLSREGTDQNHVAETIERVFAEN